MKKRKMKKFLQKVRAQFSLVFSLPSLWVALVILACAIISVLISKKLDEQDSAFASSVFSNIFAGLITGFALSILSGVKAVYIAYLEARYDWLEEAHIMLLDFNSMHHKLLSASKMTNVEFSDKAYDTGARANWVNDKIIQGTFDKTKWFDPPKYFLKHYDYDCMKMSETLEAFRESLFSVGFDSEKRSEDIELFRPIINVMMNLNGKILKDMKLIKIRVTSSRKSIV